MGQTRVFIAVPTSEEIRAEVGRLQGRLARRFGGVRWTELESLHITLLFLGETEDEKLPRLHALAREAVAAAGQRPFDVKLSALGCFPDLRRPRVLWVGVGAGHTELKRLHTALAERLAEIGYVSEDRPYAPHLTLGRLKAAGAGDEVAAALAEHAAWEVAPWPVEAVHIMASKLHPERPRYSLLESISLPTNG